MRYSLIVVASLLIGETAIAQQTHSNIGYPSVAAALKAERDKPGVSVSVQDGWTLINDRANATLWSFTPSGHAAHPAAVRRKVVQRGTGIFVEMAVKCEAPKAACDKLVAEFNQLNQRVGPGR